MSRTDYATTTAVLFGALVLFGPVSFLALAGASVAVAGVLGVTLQGWPVLVGTLLAAGLALDAAAAVAAVRLHGFEAIDAGPTHQRARRVTSLALTSLAGFVVVIDYAVEFVAWGFAHDQVHLLAAGLVLLAAVAWVGVRAVHGFRRGFAA